MHWHKMMMMDNGGNSAEQSISQSQSSSQNSQVVSGGDTIGSGSNINVQNQANLVATQQHRAKSKITYLFFNLHLQFNLRLI